jgi:hypothetical protein
MPSLLYKSSVNQVMDFPSWRRPGTFMNVVKWEHYNIAMKFLDVAKFTTNYIIIINIV